MRIATRLMKGGMVQPSPPACADMVAACAVAMGSEQDPVKLYNMVHRFPSYFSSPPPGVDSLP
eukprot:8444283-Pyramimonas_sp.AAC.1